MKRAVLNSHHYHERADIEIVGVHFPKRYLQAVGISGVRFYGDKFEKFPEFAHSARARLIEALLPFMDVEVRISERIQLVCTHECLAAGVSDYACECRCRGAFHGMSSAPPGVTVVSAGERAEYEPAIEVTYSGVIRKGRSLSVSEIHAGLREQLHSEAVRSLRVKAGAAC